MTRVRRQPAQERGQKTQEAILRGAAIAFERSGYAGTSLTEISEFSGISQGSMYFHFKSKEQIALAVIQEQQVRIFAHVDESFSRASDAFEQLIRVSRTVCDLLSSDVVVRAGMGLTLENGALQEASASSYEEWTKGADRLLQRAEDAGTIEPGEHLQEAGRSLVGYFIGTHLVSQTMNQRQDLLPAVGTMWTVMIHALVPEATRTRYQRIVEQLFH